METTPRFVLEAGRERQRVLAGVGGAGGSSGEITCPSVSVVVDNVGSPRDIPGRNGERVQEEAVEREREEAVERPLQWRLA